jgi:Ser/Thr protein kinase RdoA (MazF antagonist)
VTPDVGAWDGVAVSTAVTGGARNDVWQGTSHAGPVAIRRSRRSAASLAWELELITFLDRHDFVVPVPHAARDGVFAIDGVVVSRWIDGIEPVTPDDWRLVARELRRLHDACRTWPQRPGCVAVSELARNDRSVDADLSVLPDDVAADVLAVFATVAAWPRSVVHGDPGAANIRITADGRVGLLDWDESRVDVVLHDLSELGAQVLDDDEQRVAQRLSHAWETANAWTVEPRYARRRLAQLRGDGTGETAGETAEPVRDGSGPNP